MMARIKQGCCPCCGQAYRFTRVKVSLDHNTISYDRQTVTLAPRNTEIVFVLASRMPATVRRDFMVEQVYGADFTVDGRNCIDMHMVAIRRAIAPLGLAIETIKEVGWRMVFAEQFAMAAE